MRKSAAIMRTIDELVSAPRNYSNGEIENTIWILVRYDTHELIETLELDTNIPSEYDLLIMHNAIDALGRLDDFDFNDRVDLNQNLLKVLEIYKNRKV